MSLKAMNLNIARLVHNDRESYVKEGYGNKGVEYWPFYYYINQFLSGKEEYAKDLWVTWLVDQYSKYGSLGKHKGGMKGGSVYKYAAEKAGSQNPDLLRWRDIERGARMLVERRVDMIRSIRDKGFDISKGDRVVAVRVTSNQTTRYVLQGGHHRAATLHALGFVTFPRVCVRTPFEHQCHLVRHTSANFFRRIVS